MTPPASSGAADAAPVLVVPGIGSSGPAHWQTLWEASDPAMRRVEQDDWDRPVYAHWAARLDAAVRAAGPRCVLVAHSMGCLLVARWAGSAPVAGALLVAVPDPAGPAFPVEADGFHDIPLAPLPFPSVVVASDDDPYDPAGFGARCAAGWGSELVGLTGAGHVNAESGLGDWPAGRGLLRGLRG